MDDFLHRLMASGIEGVVRVLLYGSRARGDFHEESDLDIAVVFQGERPQQYPAPLLDRLVSVAYDLQWDRGFDIHISPRPVFEGQLSEPSATTNPDFYLNILREGITWAGQGALHAA